MHSNRMTNCVVVMEHKFKFYPCTFEIGVAHMVNNKRLLWCSHAQKKAVVLGSHQKKNRIYGYINCNHDHDASNCHLRNLHSASEKFLSFLRRPIWSVQKKFSCLFLKVRHSPVHNRLCWQHWRWWNMGSERFAHGGDDGRKARTVVSPATITRGCSSKQLRF